MELFIWLHFFRVHSKFSQSGEDLPTGQAGTRL